MANTKISQLPSATTPVVGTEVLPIVQSSTTSKVSIANLTAGRAVSASSYDAAGATAPANGMFLPTANQIGFSTASGQVAQFYSSATGGSFEIDDASSVGYNGQRYLNVRNKNTGTSAYSSVISTSLNVNAKLSAFSPSHTTTALANKAVLWGYDAVGASSGTVVADFSTGANQIQFYLGTTASPLSVAHFLGAEGSLEVSDFAVNAGYNSQRYIVVSNVSTGTSAYAWTGAKALNVNAKLAAFSPSHTTTALANKSVLFGADGASGASGTAIADFSTGTNQIQFYVGTVASPTLAGTISSTGNWNLYTATLTAGSFTPTSSSFQANSIYYPSTNTISVTNNSAVTASFTSANNFDVGTGNPTNASRSIIATNLSTGTSANASVSARSDVQYANLQAYSSTYPAAGGVTIAGKAILYAAGSAGSSGLTLWDNSNSQSMQFVMGSTVAATINSSAVLSLTNNPILTGGTANGVAYLNGSKALTTDSTKLYFNGTNFGVGTSTFATGSNFAVQTASGKFDVASYGGSSIQIQSNASFGYTVPSNSYDHIWFQSTTELMRLTGAGNLLVGTTTTSGNARLSEKLVVVNTGSVYGGMSLTGYAGTGSIVRPLLDINRSRGTTDGSFTAVVSGDLLGSLLFRGADGAAFQDAAMVSGEVDGAVASGSVAGRLTFSTAPAGGGVTERARIDSGGIFMVGKTSAAIGTVGAELRPGGVITSTLSASTNSDLSYQLYSTGAGAYRFYVGLGGTVYATSIVISAISDERLKENVRDLETGLGSIMALKPRRFDWKEGKGQDKKDVAGFIAQEFETVFPECVGTSFAGEDGIEYKNINHETLIPTLVKAIQELKAEIDALKAA